MKNTIKIEVVDGHYNIYQPLFIFANQKQYEDFVKKLYLSPMVISETIFKDKEAYICLKKEFYDYCDEVVNRHESKLSDLVYGIGKIYEEMGISSKIIKLNDDDNINYINNNDVDNKTKDMNDKVTLNITPSNKKTMYRFESSMLLNQEELIAKTVAIANQSNKYGLNELDLKDLLLLYPICMQIENEKILYADVSLNLFHIQKFAVLKISIPINNLQLNKNTNDILGGFIDKLSLPSYLYDYSDISYIEVEKNIYTCTGKYCDYIKSLVSNVEVNSEKPIEFIAIGKINPGTRNLENTNNEVKKVIYQVLKAPIDQRVLSDSNIKKQYNEYWGTEFIRFYFSGMGRIIGLAGDDLLGVPHPEKETEENYLYIMTESLESDIEFPIYLTLFKRLNNIRTIYLMNNNKISLQDLRRKHKECERWIISLKEKCYGTVYELLDYMDDAMQLFLQDKYVKVIIENTESIILEEQTSINKSISMILSMAGLVIAAVFGLPQIVSTVEIIRLQFNFSDIPFVSITGISIVIWIVLLISIILMIFNRKKSDINYKNYKEK